VAQHLQYIAPGVCVQFHMIFDVLICKTVHSPGVCVFVIYGRLCVWCVCIHTHMLVGVLSCRYFHSPGVRVCVIYGYVHAPTPTHKHITRNLQLVASGHRSCVIHLLYFLISLFLLPEIVSLHAPGLV
jgi:hypothetical protein